MATRIDMVGLFVSDLQQMISFYRDVLKFSVDHEEGQGFATVNNEGVRFGLFVRDSVPEINHTPPRYEKGLNNTFSLALDFPKFEDVDVEFKKMVEAGASPVYEPRNEPWGMRSSMVADPEGNLIEVGSWNKGVAK